MESEGEEAMSAADIERLQTVFLDKAEELSAYVGTYVGKPAIDGTTTIDGCFDVSECIRALLTAMREPSEEMIDSEGYRHGLWSRRNIEAYIDTLLGET